MPEINAPFMTDLSRLVQLGWVDTYGRELTWRHWQRQRKRYPFIWVPDEEAEAELEIHPGKRSKPRYARPSGRD